jgi:hypothetical protein
MTRFVNKNFRIKSSEKTKKQLELFSKNIIRLSWRERHWRYMVNINKKIIHEKSGKKK